MRTSEFSTMPLIAGVSMKILEKDKQEAKFTFEHSHSYQQIQREFLAAVSSLTPDDIIVGTSTCFESRFVHVIISCLYGCIIFL